MTDHGALSRPGVEDRLGYCGYVWDRWLAVYHVRHRAYMSYHGRWYQPDPIGFAGGRNWFEYCGGSPGMGRDSMGLDSSPSYWESWTLWWNDGAYPPLAPPTAGQQQAQSRREIDSISDVNSLEFTERYGDGYPAGGGSAADRAFRERAALVGTVLRVSVEVAASLINDGLDSVMALNAVMDEPGKWQNYVAILPFIPMAIRNLDDAKKVAQLLGREYDSGVLRSNLKKFGLVGGHEQVAHHIIGGSRAAVELRDRLAKAGIDINDAANGMFLDRKFHDTLANQGYRDRIIERFKGIVSEDEFLAELDKLKGELLEEQAKFRAKQSGGKGASDCK